MKKLKQGANLYELSDGLEQYKGYVISEIDARNSQYDKVSFTNGEELITGQVIGNAEENYMARDVYKRQGQNLQDCDYLINYDIHWNPVRIIQRFGRIDRIGSSNQVIQLVNFWPNINLDDYINLKNRVAVSYTHLIAGGWIAVVIILVIVLIAGFVAAIFNSNGDMDYDSSQIPNSEIVLVAKAQIGNEGGDKFWKWYGFEEHVHWCACYVSWCANECGYIDKGIIPKFSVCTDGIDVYKRKVLHLTMLQIQMK